MGDNTKRPHNGLLRGEESPYWKGEKAGYWARHKYMQRHWDKPEKCEDCNKIKKLEWANISGNHERIILDYKALCRRCHMIFDGKMFDRDKNGRFKKRNIKWLTKITT